MKTPADMNQQQEEEEDHHRLQLSHLCSLFLYWSGVALLHLAVFPLRWRPNKATFILGCLLHCMRKRRQCLTVWGCSGKEPVSVLKLGLAVRTTKAPAKDWSDTALGPLFRFHQTCSGVALGSTLHRVRIRCAEQLKNQREDAGGRCETGWRALKHHGQQLIQAVGQKLLHASEHRFCCLVPEFLLALLDFSSSFGRMEQILNTEEMLFMSGLSENGSGPSCEKHQPLQESELQYCSPTSGGQSPSLTAAATSVHPLVPLLLCSDRHLPLSSPYSQPISEPVARHADTPSWTRPCYPGNSVCSRQAVKKPLNAFMLYMKEMRHQVQQEGREKESSAINRILGRKWHALSRSEQSKYYDLAQKERLLHMQLYPGWSARDNYGKRKRKQSQQQLGGSPSRYKPLQTVFSSRLSDLDELRGKGQRRSRIPETLPSTPPVYPVVVGEYQ
ncbi:hypothetical protein CHARACLAT_005425 [Characodon lateralis]|uniref:HMG box domain-containing protein n=1 Tax=Characodon lateralis TaxID=208331 RepID=A0ABU7ESB5_9TELE|nr:hypothetical protein [Characodon lateralis]